MSNGDTFRAPSQILNLAFDKDKNALRVVLDGTITPGPTPDPDRPSNLLQIKIGSTVYGALQSERGVVYQSTHKGF